LTLLTAISGIALANSDGGRIARKNKNKRKKLKVCWIKFNLEK
jgi:hypothetical protein